MKKTLAILLAAVMIFAFTACGSSEDTEQDTSKESAVTVLEALVDEGWTATDDGYEKQDSGEYCNTRFIARLDGSALILELYYDYFDQNEEIQQLYTDNEETAPGIASGRFADIEKICGAEFEELEYSVFVGDKPVGEGTMSAAEAREAAAEYDD